MRERLVFFLLFILAGNFSFGTEFSQLRFNHFTVEQGLSQNTILSVVEDKYGFIWLGTWEGVNRFDGYNFKVFRAEEDNPGALTNNRISIVVIGKDGNVWVKTGDERFIFSFDYVYEKFRRIKPASVPQDVKIKLNSYLQKKRKAENKEYTWEATTSGLLQTKKSTNQSFLYKSDKSTFFAIADNIVTTAYIDSKNNLWVGTQSAGVHVSNLKNKQFNYYPIGNSGMSDKTVRAITFDQNGNLWVGTEANGVTVFDRKDPLVPLKHFGDKKLINRNIRSIFCDSHGIIWIGTKGGLDKYNPVSGQFRHFYAKAKGSISDPWVFAITEDSQGTIWVGTFDGLSKYDRKTDSFSEFSQNHLLKNRKIRAILEDSNKNLWIATEGGGVICFKRNRQAKNGQFIPTYYLHDENNPNSLINNLVLTLTEDENQNIWIGTNSGLCFLNLKTGDFKRFSSSNGFPDDLIMALQSDKKGNVWVSHKKGLSCINIATQSFRNYNMFDGLQGNDFTQNASFRDSNTGELFFGGTNGINSFFSEQISAINQISQPIFTGLKVLNQKIKPGDTLNGQLILEKSLLHTKRICLNWNNNNFSISFSALNFSNPQGCIYKYKLQGIDRDWIFTDASAREATYTYLPAGSYTLEVFAANSDGIWSKKQAKIQIEILPAWWWSGWAKLIYTILLSVLLWFIYRYLKSRIEYKNTLALEQLKNTKNEELMNLKLQFFTEISHEFRTPLTLIIDPLEQLMNETVKQEQKPYLYSMMNRNARQLLSLINQLLDFRKLQSGKLTLNCTNQDIVAFVNEVKSVFEQKAIERNIRFVLESSFTDYQLSFDTDKMRKIITNLVANAFRFTPDFGEIIIRIKVQTDLPEHIIIEVKDNGTGIAAEHHEQIFEAFFQVKQLNNQSQSSGLGLALTKELVLLHGGTINVLSSPGKGACFSFSIPILHSGDNKATLTENIETTASENIIRFDEQTEISGEAELPLVLIIDDQADIRQYLQLQLSSLYRIESAENGLDGFNKAIETIPDLIISDIMMPELDGIELCKRIKTHELTSHIPVILLTARQSDEAQIEGYETGADAYVVKPFNSKLLQARIINLLTQRKKLRKLFSDNKDVLNISKLSVNITDEAFLSKVLEIIHQNIEDPDFDQDVLSEKLKISRSQLYRKIRALTNRSVHEFIISVRMNKARELLLSAEFSISETAYKVGFSLPTNFTRTFTKHFGVTPKKYLENHRQ